MKIAIDFDGTTADFLSPLIDWANKAHQHIEDWIPLTVEMINEWNPTLPNNVELFDLIVEGLQFPEVTANMKPYPGAIEIIKKLQENHEIIFITNRADWYIDRGMEENAYRIKGATTEWLIKHFGIDFKCSVYFSAEIGGKHRINADFLIDDYHQNITRFIFERPSIETRRVGILIERKWNECFRCKVAETDYLVFKKNWKEIGEYFCQLNK